MEPEEPFAVPPSPEQLPSPVRPPSEEEDAAPLGRVQVAPRTGGILGSALSLASVVAVVAVVLVAIAGRSLRGPPASLTVLVTFLPYLTLTLAVWLFGLWSLVPDRRAPPVLLAVVGLFGAGLWGPTWASRGEEASGDPIRVLSWNVRRLWGGPEDGGDPKACVARAIAEAEPDVVALLEVSAEDVAYLSAHLGLDCVHSDYTGSGAQVTGGLAACVRRSSPWKLTRGWAERFVDQESWYYAFAEVERDGRRANLLAVHLHPYSFQPSWIRASVDDFARGRARGLFDLFDAGEAVTRGQGAQTNALLARVEALRDPTIIAGDFNSTRDAHLHARLREHLTDAWERGGQGFGATVRFGNRVPLRIDYVYASRDFAVQAARTAPVGCSDHGSIGADLVLRGSP